MLKFCTSAIISLPFLISFTLMYFSYELSGEEKIALPLGISLLTIIFLEFKVKFTSAIRLQFLQESKIISLLSYSIIAWGLLDLYDHGLVILNPLTYSTFLPHQAWIRHFSSLCWILSPIAILLPLRRIQKISFFTWAFLFPVLVVDRNRLLLAFFATIVSLIFSSLHWAVQKR